MKIMVSFLSALIIFIGAIPFFGEGFIIPNTGMGYSLILIGVGILIIIAAIVNGLLMMLEKTFLIFQGLMLCFMGALALLPDFFPFIPTEGIVYSVIIIAIGLAGLVFGFVGMA